MTSTREAIVVSLCMLGVAGVVSHFVGCLPQSAKEAAADSAYAAEQLKCVDEQPTKLQIDTCRANVRAQWHAVRDASADVNAEGGDR